MKTSHTLLSLAASASLVVALLNLELAAALAFAAALIGFAFYDYTRPSHSWAAGPALRGSVKRHRERLGLAA